MSTILLVEDNADDAELALIGLKHVSDRHHIELATDGRQALEFLYAEGRYAHRPSQDDPALVLLDINLPNGNGLSILQRMRASREYHKTPVLILTSSDDLIDIAQTRQFGANSYLQKTVDYRHFTSRLHQELDHWLAQAG
ncbi:response regulator [uncultured Gilvimarinus sp.]|uniref:response regulator n=1 Tax=uncultured Gilvimarinus sp. TaxID=1689143 RepID=UPI0030EC5451|tara:strand:- start:4263 stop:4682 length:420 start_codon:yes stop_codon:yes gene_type:complete